MPAALADPCLNRGFRFPQRHHSRLSFGPCRFGFCAPATPRKPLCGHDDGCVNDAPFAHYAHAVGVSEEPAHSAHAYVQSGFGMQRERDFTGCIYARIFSDLGRPLGKGLSDDGRRGHGHGRAPVPRRSLHARRPPARQNAASCRRVDGSHRVSPCRRRPPSP